MAHDGVSILDKGVHILNSHGHLFHIAGPYRSSSLDQVQENIRIAKAVAFHFWSLGSPVICPHLNSAFMEGVSDHIILSGYLRILSHCDSVVLLPKWRESKGAS